MKTIPSKIIRQIFTLLIIVAIGGLIFKQLLPYLSGVLGAITLYVLLKGWMVKLVRRGWNKNLAAALLMVLSFVGILLPVSGIIAMLGSKVGDVVKNSERFINAFKEQLNIIEAKWGYEIASNIDVSAISGWLSHNLQNIAGNTFSMFIAIAIMYFMLYYMLVSPTALKKTLQKFSPFSTANMTIIGDEGIKMVRSNALGIPLVALAQGVIALIGFLIFGIENPFFWFVIVIIGSMIPFIGTLIGILPIFFISLSTGNTFQAWAILIYGIVVVGSTDNLIRLFVLKKLDGVHPLITLIGVIIGVPLFGFIGLIFGPLLISLFFILIQLYQKEYGEDSV
jgi:predicted PurR-regulated permease PerM